MKTKRFDSNPVSVCLKPELREKLTKLPNFSIRLREVIEKADARGEFDER